MTTTRDLVAQLRAQVEALTGALADAQDEAHALLLSNEKLRADRDALLAANQQLRDALADGKFTEGP